MISDLPESPERKKEQGSPEEEQGWIGCGAETAAHFADYWLQLACLRTIELLVTTCELQPNDFGMRPRGQGIVG